MGCLQSTEAGSSSAASSSQGGTNGPSKVKILLLGTGQSGKSTIAKQLRVLHAKNFSDGERATYRDLIRCNLVEEVRVLGQAVERLKLEVTDEVKDFLTSIAAVEDAELSLGFAELAQTAWKLPAIQQAYAAEKEFVLNDSAPYFFDRALAIVSETYVPTNGDIMRSRQMTTGITRIKFKMGGYDFTVLDAGGQRSQRHAWKEFFTGLAGFIFVVAISEYDQSLAEDGGSNRLLEALRVFKDLCNSHVLRHAAVVLFLNKNDVFKTQLKKNPITVCFPNYKGDPHAAQPAAQYIQKKFRHFDRGKDNREIFCHITCATDTENVDHVFAAVKDKLVSTALTETGVL